MLYQLPNGKVINIAVEDYLNLTDEDIQALVALNYGEYPSSYWYKSCIDIGEIPQKEVLDDMNLYTLEEQDEYMKDITHIDINSIPDEDSDFTDL
jgi:hypothetical protein